MTKYKVKSGVEFDAIQWTENSSFEGVNKFCVNWLIKTAYGMLRVGIGNWVLRGPNGYRTVIDAATFDQIFEKAE